MNKSKIISVLLPTLIMILLSLLFIPNDTSSSFNKIDFKGLSILIIILFYPSLFFIEGVAVACTKTNPILALVISLLTFIIILFIFLNSSALIYAVIYSLIYLLGYSITKLCLKYKKILVIKEW